MNILDEDIMNPINLEKILLDATKGRLAAAPAFLRKIALKAANRLFRIPQFNKFLSAHKELKNLDLIDEFFTELDFSYSISEKDSKRIPSEGGLICVANHPLGGLDALAIIKAIAEVRPDVKIMANSVLSNIEDLNDIFLPYDIFSNKIQRKQIADVEAALSNESAVIVFPAGEVSRMSWKGLNEKKWQKGAVRLAAKMNRPVLPIFVKARNSALFYIVSSLYKRASTFLLPREIFNKRGKTIELKIGDPIPAEVFKSKLVNTTKQIKLLKKHVFNIGKGKPPVLKTEKTIIRPIDARDIKSEIKRAPVLSFFPGDKRAVLIDAVSAPNTMKEIARLREITFRKAGEGTGRKCDSDKYDAYYKHIVLWDEEEREIIGSYRLGVCSEIIDKYGVSGIYNSELFRFSEEFVEKLKKSIELGRSFIREKYWRTNALDNLWKGIGAFLQTYYPEIRYFFGAVSISDSYSDEAKKLIVTYYKKWYSSDEDLVTAKNRFNVGVAFIERSESVFTGANHKEDFKILKDSLKQMGYAVPVLMRNYVDLTEHGGCKFLDFGVDPGFANSIDSMAFLDLSMMASTKRERYLGLVAEDRRTTTEA